MQLKEYMGKVCENYKPVELVDVNELWDELVIPYIRKKFNLHKMTVKRLLWQEIGYMYYRSVPINLFIDAYAQNWVDGLCIDSIDSWNRYIDTTQGYDYCRTYYGKFYMNEISQDIPDYYNDEITSWIWEKIESILRDLGYGIEFGEGDPTDMYICTQYRPDMYIEHITLITDDDIQEIDDQLYIQQLMEE